MILAGQQDITIKQEKDSSKKTVVNGEDTAQRDSVSKSCPVITAPTLQKHLLSPIINKSFTKACLNPEK